MLETDRVDIALDEDGDLDIDTDIRFTTGKEAVAQGCDIAVNTSKGEVFTDLDEGVPWFQEILGQPFNEALMRTRLREALLTVPGVASVSKQVYTYSNQTREVNADIDVTTDWGDTVEGVVNPLEI